MKNILRASLLCMSFCLLAYTLNAQTIQEESDSTQSTPSIQTEEYCESSPETSPLPQDSVEDKSWKLRIDLKNWIIQIRKDQ